MADRGFEGKYPKTDQYLSLMKASDDAFEYLIDYFEQSGGTHHDCDVRGSPAQR